VTPSDYLPEIRSHAAPRRTTVTAFHAGRLSIASER
jgi:hypothetical protein